MLFSYAIFYFISVSALYIGSLWFFKDDIKREHDPLETKTLLFACAAVAALLFPLTVPLAAIFVAANKIIK